MSPAEHGPSATELAADVCIALGFAAVVYGLALISVALAFVVGGAVLFLAGVVLTFAAPRRAAAAASTGFRPRSRRGKRERRHLAAVNRDNPFNEETARP